MKPIESYETLLYEILPSVLSQYHYSRRNETFYRHYAGNWGLINFQKSIDSTEDKIKFTINLGVVSERLRQFELSTIKSPEKTPKVEEVEPEIDACHWRMRIGHYLPNPFDKWWNIDSETEVESLFNTIAKYTVELGISEVQRHIRDEDLRDLWLGKLDSPHPSPKQLRNLAFLLQELGPRDKLEPVLAKLNKVTKSVSDRTAKQSVKRLREVTRARQNQETAKLVGIWVLDPQDARSLEKFGQWEIEFGADGAWRSRIERGSNEHVFEHDYRVEKGTIVAISRLSGIESQTRFKITPEDKLILFNDRKGNYFVRKPQ